MPGGVNSWAGAKEAQPDCVSLSFGLAFRRERFLSETGKPHQFLFGTSKPHLHSVHQVVHLWQHQLARQDGLRSWGSQHRRMLALPNYLALPPAACRSAWPQAAPQAAVQRAIQPPCPANAKVTLSRWNAFCRPAVSSRSAKAQVTRKRSWPWEGAHRSHCRSMPPSSLKQSCGQGQIMAVRRHKTRGVQYAQRAAVALLDKVARCSPGRWGARSWGSA